MTVAGHSFTTTVVGTNCTEVGHTVYTCACGYSYEDGSNGHTFTTLVVEPSETINGFTLYECECGYSYQSNPVASLAGASDTVDVISNTKVYDYVYNGSTLTQLTITTTITGDGTTTEVLYFTYDGSSPMAVTYGDNIYYYVTNLQGDVIAILDASGNAVVEYVYDAWGNILTTSGTMATTLGVANPLTYRGYVYDAESALYYLQSRYYNPEVGRFINADALVSTGQGLLGNNMFAYCLNNPTNNVDPAGYASRLAERYVLDCPSPGKTIYDTPYEAAFYAGVLTRMATNSNNREYICGVYELYNGGYVIGKQYIGEHASASPQDVLEEFRRFIDRRIIAMVHSHPYCTGHIPNEFSEYDSAGNMIGDLACAFQLQMPIFLAAPNGELKILFVLYDETDQSYKKYSGTVCSGLPIDNTLFDCRKG